MDVGLQAMSHMVTVSLILQFHTFGPFLITFLTFIIIDIKINIFHSSESVHHSQLIANVIHKGTTVITHGKHGLFLSDTSNHHFTQNSSCDGRQGQRCPPDLVPSIAITASHLNNTLFTARRSFIIKNADEE